MRFTKVFLLSIFFLGFLGVVSACTILGGGSPAATSTPIPTFSVSDLQVVPAKACKVAEQGMIRVENPQGDLMAWSPVDSTVAYIASTSGSTWNVGDLNILAAPQFNTPSQLATQVAGELTWAPDASSIAYLGLRRSDNLYTIGLAYPDGRSSLDLYPDEAARTDDYASQKSILNWINAAQLRVLVSCGMNCLQTEDIGLRNGSITPVGDPIEMPWDLYAPHTFHPAEIPSQLTKLAGQLNWSWDERQIAFIDQHGNAWVINVVSNTVYPLDIGQYGTATETDWSYDNQYLAVQVDQYLMIFSFQCP